MRRAVDIRPDRIRQGLRKGLPGVAGAFLVAVVLWGCTPPDRLPQELDGLPESARAYLDPERSRAFQLEPGIMYRSIRSGSRPWRVHLVEIDPGVCEVGFKVVRADEEDSPRQAVSALSRKAAPGVVVAINGDFYTEEDVPVGLEASDGRVRGWAARPVFAWRPGEGPRVGMAIREGDSIRVADFVLSADRPDAETELVSGFPALLEAGRWVGDLEQADRPGFASIRQPRTAVGWDPAGERIWWVVVDGRRSGSSEGMTLPELARLFQALGASEAFNLDGGGSSAMAIRGRTVSRPSDFLGERPVVNALVVRHDPSLCPDPDRQADF